MVQSLQRETAELAAANDALVEENARLIAKQGQTHSGVTSPDAPGSGSLAAGEGLEAENAGLRAMVGDLQAKVAALESTVSGMRETSAVAAIHAPGVGSPQPAGGAGAVHDDGAETGGAGASPGAAASFDGGFGSDSDSDSCGSLGLDPSVDLPPTIKPKREIKVPLLKLGGASATEAAATGGPSGGVGQVVGYQDEFMAHADEWSKSWREEAGLMPTTQLDSGAGSDAAGAGAGASAADTEAKS